MKFCAVVYLNFMVVHAAITWGQDPDEIRGDVVSADENKNNVENGVQGKYPYQVSVWWEFPPEVNASPICSGALLNDEWVLSAAHCFTDLPRYGKFIVYSGKYDINVVEAAEQSSTVGEAVTHPLYRRGTIPHDLILIRLETPFDFTPSVSAIALPQQNAVHTGSAVRTGWNPVLLSERNILPSNLQVVTLPIIANGACSDVLRNQLDSDLPPDGSVLCTGPSDGSRIVSCSADAGAPLVQMVDDDPVLIGVLSRGGIPCDEVGTPSAYARVSSDADWIAATIAERTR